MNKTFSTTLCFKSLSVLALSIGLAACGNGSWWSKDEPTMEAEQIKKAIPPRVNERLSWANDIYDISDQLGIPTTKENVCTIVAVVDQESNFVADPHVPGLGEKAVKEVQDRLEEKFKDKLGDGIGGTVAGYFQDVLKNQPSPEDNYLSQMRRVQTERELDELYREIFDYMSKHYHVSALTGAAKLVGQDIGEKLNPITTLGSMQVHIGYAKDHKRQGGNIAALRTDMYSQYGGLYYGIHRLMMYPAEYDKPIYRFADYNSGRYSSRNAAFQSMLNDLTPAELGLDGDLLLYNKDGSPRSAKSQSETALIAVFAENNVIATPRQIRSDLKKEKDQDFEDTLTYKAVKKLYQEKTGKEPFYAMMPEVVISGPKLSRDYNTNWFATRVDGRYQTCMRRIKNLKL
ncbi:MULTISPECIES: DUF1615 domain-containing protein [Acinetobacter]|uniref:DUF1615 domain-containing protein n=1 Tax=Acinetobacter TaxID=469 RepID=UPI0015D2128F|nr:MULTISPECIES: DUF1615 domain-containing protein [Acinetobacter]MCL6238479.1 DUF1615 domain-containing protein [Acinetobacter amyesii]QOW49991.1 DUF1615 family protein [Acinetobacter sp. YH12138]UUS56379.1 DUF1615 domain-containing protein [Acinetobacter sp. YH16040_T]UUS62038.1 DUF1615 domain-containing protein [Acinetobacter sp. YH16056_T]